MTGGPVPVGLALGLGALVLLAVLAVFVLDMVLESRGFSRRQYRDFPLTIVAARAHLMSQKPFCPTTRA